MLLPSSARLACNSHGQGCLPASGDGIVRGLPGPTEATAPATPMPPCVRQACHHTQPHTLSLPTKKKHVQGDNDPVDVVEIGSVAAETGGVYPVKVLGVFAMIDDGELDWKVIAIRADDPKAAAVNDVEDVEREFPGELQRVYEWFRDYKIPDGKPANKFGFDNKAQNREFALGVIEETHDFWRNLVSGKRENSEELSLF